jgi:glycosyltransferase involved in cell wall biosynthesis
MTQYYPPEVGAPPARLHGLAKILASKQHEVTVLTVLPNYPTGRILKGYGGRLRMVEYVDGIKVVRVWLLPSKSANIVPRLVSYISFGVCSLAFGLPHVERHDVVLIESPPLFIMPFALLVSRVIRAKSIMMVSDIWPDILIRMGRMSERSIFVRAMMWLERFSYNHVDAVALTNPGAREQIRSRYPALKATTVISNGVDTSVFRPGLRSASVRRAYGGGNSDFLVGYCGLHGLAQGLDDVLVAAQLVQGMEWIKMVMIGDGPVKESLMRKARAMRLKNLMFHAPLPKHKLPPIVASLDCSLIPLARRFPGTMPSKVYEALASRTVPVVARGSEAQALVERNRAGLSYEPGDPHGMADAIVRLTHDRDLREQLRANGLRLAARFDRRRLAEQTERIMSAVIEGRELPEFPW